MESRQSWIRRKRVIGLVAAIALIVLCGSGLGVAQTDDTDFIPLETSVNALMVALVDHAAHEIWEAGSKATLTGRDWQTVEQHAIQLVAAGTLISLGGTGRADKGWVMTPAWQEWSRKLTDGGLAALAAFENLDQRALYTTGQNLVDTCLGCHEAFKPEVPTEGLMHVPHYED
jgi:hypothetical protein